LTTRLEIGDSTGGVFATVTMNVTFVLCVCPPLIPLMVTVFVPAGVEPEVGDRERRSSSAVERRRIEAGANAINSPSGCRAKVRFRILPLFTHLTVIH